MNDFSEFQRTAQLARRERAPRVDVTSQVLAAIHRSRYRVARVDSPALVFAGVSLAAAALVAIWAVPAWESVQDPLVALFRPLSLVLE